MASTGTSVLADSKVKIHKFEKKSGICKWRQAVVFDNWVHDAMDQLLIGNLDTESNVAVVWLGWHLEGEAKIIHSSFRKNPAPKYLDVTTLPTEHTQFCIPFIYKDQLGTEFRAIKQIHTGRSSAMRPVTNEIKPM